MTKRQTVSECDRVAQRLSEIEARRDQLAAERDPTHEQLEVTEADIAARRAEGQDTTTLEAEAERLRIEIGRTESSLVVCERKLSELRAELRGAQLRRYSEIVPRVQDELYEAAQVIKAQFPKALASMRDAVDRAWALRAQLSDLHTERRKLDGRWPLPYPSELNSVQRRDPEAWSLLHNVHALLETGRVSVPEPPPAPSPPTGRVKDVLERLEGHSRATEIQQRLGMI